MMSCLSVEDLFLNKMMTKIKKKRQKPKEKESNDLANYFIFYQTRIDSFFYVIQQSGR